MRKLAREAVIFMLLGWVLLTAGIFVYFHVTIPTKIVLDMSTSRPLTEAEKQTAPPDTTGMARALPPSRACLDFSSVGDCTDLNFFEVSLYLGLLGFPVGLGLWVFYRIVRFAIKG
jgi:hypothetical protein